MPISTGSAARACGRDDAGADRTDPPRIMVPSLTFHLDLTDDGGPLAREACSPAGPYNLQHDPNCPSLQAPLSIEHDIRKSGYRFSEKIMLKTTNWRAALSIAGSRP